jgi:hypothetical protein
MNEFPDIFFVVYKNPRVPIYISEHITLLEAQKDKRKMIRQKIYLKEELEVWGRPLAFGEGPYGF